MLYLYPEKINWFGLYRNPDIFELDYESMRQANMELKQELMERMFHPKNVAKFESWGYNDF
jgi:hypothetical protein